MMDPMSENPRITDNDAGEIEVTLGTRRLRRLSYGADTDRRAKMRSAREYVEGFLDGWCEARSAALMK